MNELFQIYLDSPDEKNIKFGSVIKLLFRNVSGQEVFFPVGYRIKLFVIKNNKWIEIPNTVEYYGEGSLLQTKSEQALGGRIGAWVRPVLPSEITTEDQEILRILVVGELLTNGEKTGIPIGAYIDFLISQ